MKQDEMLREQIASAICAACGENPQHRGDARGNDCRWQDYGEAADAVIGELQAARRGEPGRSAIAHLCTVLAAACDDGEDVARLYQRAAGDAARIFSAHR